MAQIPGDAPDPTRGWRTGDVPLRTGLLGFTGGSRDSVAASYFPFAIAMHSMTIEQARNPYGLTYGTRIGARLLWRWRTAHLRAEVDPI